MRGHIGLTSIFADNAFIVDPFLAGLPSVDIQEQLAYLDEGFVIKQYGEWTKIDEDGNVTTGPDRLRIGINHVLAGLA